MVWREQGLLCREVDYGAPATRPGFAPDLAPAPWLSLSEVEGGWEGQILALAASALGWKKEGVPVNSQMYILSARAVLAPEALNSYLACLPLGARKSGVFQESSFPGLICSPDGVYWEGQMIWALVLAHSGLALEDLGLYLPTCKPTLGSFW